MLERLDAVRAIFNNLEVIVWAVDTEGTIVVSEGGGLKYLGLPPGAIVGQSFYELYGQSSDGVNNLQRSLAGETLIVQHNDHGRALESRFVPVRSESDEAVVGVIGVTQDITERLRSQAELREQAELLDLAHDAIVVRRLDGTVTYWNHGAAQIYGHSREEALGRDVHALLRTSGDLQEPRRRLLAEGFWDGEQTHTRRDGQEVLVASRWVLKRDANGQSATILQIDTDITARKQAEQAEARRREDLIRAQALAIEELSTPLIPITDDIFVMPLIGMMDSMRAQQVLQTLLDGLANGRGRFVILDITGVPVVDTAVAHALLRSAQAARLLGAEVILTGIRPEVAQTLVSIEANFTNVITRGTLQSGIAYALGRRGQRTL
ncbi:PAS domain S-box protein [Nannocystis bainbridge]|uniref:PAS domain S-box protein n=1 Tax=Nannocystis bainbridge TaxID=2995303 RepID=A0ABT5ECK3_9BACT|nr:PAS domain S-box protein [Nannocystis bainbridge]MDC0723054.1 PAS domain S-box protein [Nannocystis bainbridge]